MKVMTCACRAEIRIDGGPNDPTGEDSSFLLSTVYIDPHLGKSVKSTAKDNCFFWVKEFFLSGDIYLVKH